MIPPGAKYMVYLLIDPRDRVPFYAGMTCRPTARWHGHNCKATSSAYPRIKELRELALKCRLRIVAADLSYQEARAIESRLIADHRQTLLNRQACHVKAAA